MNVRTVTRWMGDPGWPAGGKPPFSVAKVRSWAEVRFGSGRFEGADPGPPDPQSVCDAQRRTTAEIKKLEEQARMFELKRLELEGKLIERAQHERIVVVQAQLCRKHIATFFEGIAGFCELTPEQAIERGKRELDAICARMQQDLSSLDEIEAATANEGERPHAAKSKAAAASNRATKKRSSGAAKRKRSRKR